MELERSSDRLVVKLIGSLSTENAADIEATLLQETAGVTELIFDLEKLEYISSPGLRLLLMLQKKMRSKGTMTVKNVNEDIMGIFKVTGFHKLLHIE